ncbi:MAG: hypothetical protein ACMUHY_00130 [Thermoplasmatota archaeon]
MNSETIESTSRRTIGAYSLMVLLVLTSMLGLVVLVAPYVSAAPMISILHPAEGQTIYGDRMDLNLSVSDFTLNGSAIGGANVEGEGHWHLFINGQLQGPYAVEDLELTGLPEGEHLIEVELVNNDHSTLDPQVRASVNIKVAYPTISISSPMEGAVLYDGMINLNVDVTDFMLSSDYGGENSEGMGHWHLYVNDALQGPFSDHWANLTDLPAGVHTFKVDLRNNDHTPISPPSEDSITVTVIEEMPELVVKNLPMHATGYGGMLNMQIGVMNLTLSEDYGGSNVPGEGHVHLYINDALIGPYSSEWINLTDLPEGDHIFRLELRNNDHSMLYPPVEYEFMVTIIEEMPVIDIMKPLDGDMFYSDAIDLELSVSNFMLNGSSVGMMSKPGEGHYHLYINDALIGPSVDLMRTLNDLPTGDHVMKVELVNNDHSPLMPPAMDMIHFTILEDRPMIMIVSPIDGAMIYDDMLELEVMVHNFTLNGSSYGMDSMAGEGHYHIYINEALVGPYSNTTVLLEDLPAGEHVLKVLLVNNDHSSIMPEAADMAHFTILEERPSVMIYHPMEGAILYKDSLDIEVTVENFSLNASAIGTSSMAGEGHYHIYLNGDLVGPYTNLSVVLEDLEAGTHELKVMLVNNDHTPIMPYKMDIVHFTIVDAIPSIEIIKPMDGAYFYGDMLQVEVMIGSFKMNGSAIGGNNSAGEGHWHLYINGNLMGPKTEMMVDLTGLPSGTHELKVELRNNDHTALIPTFIDMASFTLLEVPSISIVSPENGTTLDGNVLDLEVQVSDFILNSTAMGGSNMPGEGHYHIYINDELEGPHTNLTVSLSELPPGEHVLRVELRNNDHTPLGVDAMFMIHFTVPEPATEITVRFGPVMSGDEPLEGALVEIMYGGVTKTSETDQMGYAEFTLPADWEGMQIQYEISKDGYEDLMGAGTVGTDGTVDAESGMNLDKEGDGPNLAVIIILVVLVLIILGVLIFVMTRRHSEEVPEE